MPTTMPDIREFLALRRIALVGLSRHAKDFSRYLPRNVRPGDGRLYPRSAAHGGSECKRTHSERYCCEFSARLRA
jgi:hypothetical protein